VPEIAAAETAVPEIALQDTSEPSATFAPETSPEDVIGVAPATGLEGADTPADVDAAPALADASETLTEVSLPNDATLREPPEMEVFYTFTWAPRRRANPQGQQGQQRPEGAKPKPKPNRGKRQGQGQGGKPKVGKPQRDDDKPQSFAARPEKKIDPDNPFAQALAGLKRS
jgi:ATP-dependent RNA helicase SUPV3L1/SUV3